MPKKLQLKPQHGRIVTSRFGEVTNSNLTKEIYDFLVADSESHKDLFEEVEVVEPKQNNKPSKPQSNGTNV